MIRPSLSFNEVEKEFREVFEGGIFTRGPHVEAFCAELSAYVQSRHCFLTTSATTALWLCLKLLGVGPGDEVAVSDFSFPATANVVEDLGARPVFVDVMPDTYNMSPVDLASKLTARTKAVIFVDALGNPTGIGEISLLCKQRGIPLIEDAACAIGSSESGRRCGSIADLTCFSFHPRKLLSTGEGGAITTQHDAWADWLRVKLAHGSSGSRGIGLDFVDFGYNFRLPELQAVMGRKQLSQLDSTINARLEVRAAFTESIAPLGFVPQKVGEGVRYNTQSLVFRVPESVDRNQLVRDLSASGIESTLGTYCLSGTSYYSRKYNDVQPIAASLEVSTITLPCYEGIPVQRVIDGIKAALT